MASDVWNSIDKFTCNFPDYYCAFLDMLGYKQKMELFFQGKYNLYGRIQRAMASAGVETDPQNSPDGICTRIFSDSIILTAPKDKVNILSMMNYVAQLVAWFGYEGLFLRGGISYGKLWEDFTTDKSYSFLASEGLVKAYQMEMEAKYPMIVMDERIVDQIQSSSHIVKFHGKYILHFAPYIINEFGSNQEDVIKELVELVDIKNKVTNPEVKEKYEWLINYYYWYAHLCHEKEGRLDITLFDPFKKEIDPKYIFASL